MTGCTQARSHPLRMVLPIVSLVLIPVLLGAAPQPARAELKLPGVLRDHMVIQRDIPVPVWGWASPGTDVQVTWKDQNLKTQADRDGRWTVRLPASKAGGPHELVVKSDGQTRQIRDVLIGEVWLCSGQSNMAWLVRESHDAESERAAADHPAIRMFTVPMRFIDKPQTDTEGEWVVCSPDTVPRFSATAYFFGRELHGALGVPVGLLQSSVGGTRIEPWISRDALMHDPVFAERVRAMDEAARCFEAEDATARRRKHEEEQRKYEAALEKLWDDIDASDRGIRENWAAPDYDDSAWGSFPLSQGWEEAGIPELKSFDGIAWLRLHFEIPSTWAGQEVTLHLPRVDDCDTTFLNGHVVGRKLGGWAVHRQYKIPATLVKAGPAVLAIQVIDYGAGGGFVGPVDDIREHLRLELPGDESASLSLAGPWKYHLSQSDDGVPRPPRGPSRAEHPSRGWQSPTALFNGMIAPLAPYALRGAIWYQGESNAGQPEEYHALMPMLIDSWRDTWNQPEPFRTFPFGIVQLANFGDAHPDQPAPGGWAWLREAQLFTALKQPSTGLAVTIDIGDASNIHPKNKQDVGRRLALWALQAAYGRDVVYSGPVYKSMRKEDGKLILDFDHVAGGLATRDGGEPRGFAIAGTDRKFVWADVKIVGRAVVVSADTVPKPVAVRYGWASNPERVNLINAAGLPASPFRTDDWD